MHIRFKNNLDALSIRINGTTYKHCSACGLRLECKEKLLKAHYQRYHKGQDPACLGFDDPPVNCCYSNFYAYLANPETKLVLMSHIKRLERGRLPQPRPPLFAIERVEPPVRE